MSYFSITEQSVLEQEEAEQEESDENAEVFLCAQKTYVNFLMSLLTHHFIPMAAVVKINKEIRTSLEASISYQQKNVSSLLKKNNVSSDVIKQIMEKMARDPILEACRAVPTEKKQETPQVFPR